MVKRRSLPPPRNVGDAAHAVQLRVAIAALGSFTAAGDRLALTPSAVSKAVARTEVRLGVQLVKRTTRRVALIDRLFYVTLDDAKYRRLFAVFLFVSGCLLIYKALTH